MAAAILIVLAHFGYGAAPEDGQSPAASLPAAGPSVDYGYAFATPHRMAVALPDSSDKTLLDLEPGALRMAWTYDNQLNLPPFAFVALTAPWAVRLIPLVGDAPFAGSTWTRAEGRLPILVNEYDSPEGAMRIEATGGATAAILRVTLTNKAAEPRRFALRCESQRGFFGYNPAYVDPDKDSDCLLAGWGDRADRVLVAAVGADTCEVTGATILQPTWTVAPGERREGWIIRPYRANAADLPQLRTTDWAAEADRAAAEWRGLLTSAVRLQVPDAGVVDAFYACLGDLFIMREPIAGGHIAGVPGTEGYRAPNSGEPLIVSIALDQLGLHKQAAQEIAGSLEQQGPDGDWADPAGWAHLMWGLSGFKAWAVMEHYRLTGDKDYLADVYPRMLACSRFQERQRARTRILQDGARPLTYGLMPRGMGDCGLKDGDDLYGVFLPHNIWAVYLDKMTLAAAQELGKDSDAAELRPIYETALADLLESLDKGAIQADGYRWIPGVPGKTSGSRWGALNAAFPCGILPPDHELVTGTLRLLESNMSPGGLPLNTGWLADGMWVAIALDNLAETHLLRNEGDAAADLFYATLNHGTPLVTWCEERGPEPGSPTVTGDRQHLWTPVAVVRALRDMLLMEQDGAIHLARGAHRAWLASGGPVGITGAPTHFGKVSYEIRFDPAAKRLTGKAAFPEKGLAVPATLHVRLPEGLRVASLTEMPGATIGAGGTTIEWANPSGECPINAAIE